MGDSDEVTPAPSSLAVLTQDLHHRFKRKKKSEKYCGCVAEGVGGSSGQWAGAVGCLDTAVLLFFFLKNGHSRES